MGFRGLGVWALRCKGGLYTSEDHFWSLQASFGFLVLVGLGPRISIGGVGLSKLPIFGCLPDPGTL